MIRRLALVALAALVCVTARPAAAADATLRIVFPEGFSVRQMTDRVAEVRRIAIRKRHVTPALTGSAYASAARAARPPLKVRSVEGFLFPSLYRFGPATTARGGCASRARARSGPPASSASWARASSQGRRR